jgi:hypothetical protein
MPCFFCKWDDRASLIVDDDNRERAIEVAREVAGRMPATVQQLPSRFLVLEVMFEDEIDGDADDDDDGDPEVLIVSPLDHVEDELAKLHDADLPAVFAQTEPAPAAIVEGDGVCESEAEADDGRVVRCNRKSGHEGPHAADDLTW